MIAVVEAGPLATVQDLGRHGYQHLGVGVAGAADAASAALANRLVGNPPGAACIEVTMGGLHVELRAAAALALTGAVCATRVQGGPPVGFGAPAALAAGTRLALATPLDGLRTYLAVRGGIAVAPVLGSRSLDTLGGVGPPRLQPGDALPIGEDPGTPIDTDVAPLPALHTMFRIWPGPRADWFADALDHLLMSTWTVGVDSNRVGVHLDGAALVRARTGELASEALVTGAVQVPHDGRPIVMLADHPVTGGYPVVAVVDPADVAMVAQARPGTTVHFMMARPTRQH